MKVLRTALFSAFLTICFINIGHAQTPIGNPDTRPGNGQTLGNGQTTGFLPPDMYNMSMTYLSSDSHTAQVRVEYDVIAPPNSVTEIKLEGDLIPLFTQTVSGSVHISTIVTVPVKNGAGEVYIKCEVCNEDNTNCRLEGCLIITGG